MMTLLFLLPSGCRKDEGEVVAYATNISDISALQQQTELRLASPCENGKKIEILWNTKKIVNGNVYAEFLVDGNKLAISDGSKKYSKNAGAYFFADKPNNAKYTYLVFINPDSNFVMDYKKLDLFNFNKIKFTGYVHYFDLCMNFEHSNYYKDGKLIRYKNKKDANTGVRPPKSSGSRCACDPCYWYTCNFYETGGSGLIRYLEPGPYYGLYIDLWSCFPSQFDPCLSGCSQFQHCESGVASGTGPTGNGNINEALDCNDPINLGTAYCNDPNNFCIGDALFPAGTIEFIANNTPKITLGYTIRTVHALGVDCKSRTIREVLPQYQTTKVFQSGWICDTNSNPVLYTPLQIKNSQQKVIACEVGGHWWGDHSVTMSGELQVTINNTYGVSLGLVFLVPFNTVLNTKTLNCPN
jgi:hypothetical protein